MILDGVVYKINDNTFLSFLHPTKKEMTNGFSINGYMYDSLKEKEICVVNVILKDGNKELNEDEVMNILEGDELSGNENIFYSINNLTVYKFDVSVVEMNENYEYDNSLIDIITRTKNKQQL